MIEVTHPSVPAASATQFTSSVLVYNTMLSGTACFSNAIVLWGKDVINYISFSMDDVMALK